MSNDHEPLNQEDERALVCELTQQVLETTAPEELVLFDETAEEYFADPHGVLDAKGRDEAVGFGVELALLTPYILAMATPVIQLLVAILGDALKKEGQSAVNAFVRRLLGRRGPASSPQNAEVRDMLTQEQLTRVRNVAFQTGAGIGLPEDRAALLADAIVGRISVTPTT